MKAKKARNYILLIVISIINLFWFVTPLFSQEGDNPTGAWKWYYSRRAFPYDTIPSGAFENAVNQRLALFQSTGFQSLGTNWEEIGPRPYAGIFSGRIAHVVYDPRDPNELGNYIYVTGAYGGLWKTIDGGLNWLNRSGDLPSLLAGAFTLDTGRNILYFGSAGTFNTWIGAGSGMRIFMSTNDGDNWISISNGIDIGASIYKIVISPNDAKGNTLFAATSLGLFKTTNRGGIWIKIIPDDGTSLVCTDVCFSPSGARVHAVGPSSGRGYPWNLLIDGIGYYRSDDGGTSFTPITNNGFPHSSVLTATTLCAVSKAPNAEDLVWFLSYDDTSYATGYVYKSTNYGQNFTNMSVGNNNSTKYHLSLRASDVDKDICYAGNIHNYRTTNGGTSWIPFGGYYGMHGDVKGFDINPFYPDKITEGNDGGVFRLDSPGGSWISCNDSLGSLSLLWGLASSTYDANFVAGGLHDFTTFSYNSNTGPGNTYWNAASGGSGDCGNMLASPFKSKHFVSNILTGYRNIYYSSNGTNFLEASGYAKSTTNSIEVGFFTYHPSHPGEVYTARFTDWSNMNVHFRKSTDYGATWGGDGTPYRSFNRPTSWNTQSIAPMIIAISPSNPDTMIMSFGNGNEFWHSIFDARSRLIKTTNGGVTWEGIDNIPPIPIVTGGFNGTPNRTFTDVEFDPKYPNLLYLTLSGYYYPSTNEGHVFKSTDGGYNWESINGALPDIPVNDIMIHYTGTGTNDKELIITTDAGIYATKASDINWRELASDFPNTPAFHLDYNRLSGKLRANTWGRGAWEYQLDNTIYVQDRLYITDNVILDKQIIVAPGGKLIIGHSEVNSSMSITFNNGASIIVEDGGTLDANSNVAITLTSSGTWGGIEFKGTGAGTLRNCTFQNTSTPVVIESNGSDEFPHPEITIANCVFSNAPVQITNRPNVTVVNCNFSYISGDASTVLGVLSTGSDNVDISKNTITSSSSVSSSGISIVYGNSVSVRENTIQNIGIGISISNSDAFVYKNTITATDDPGDNIGIGADNSYSAAISNNTVTDYFYGIKLYSSSPVMLENTVETGISSAYCLYFEEISYPRLRPDDGGNEIVWDAGLNIVRNTAYDALYSYNESVPDLDYGCNTFAADRFYIDADFPWPSTIPPTYYYIRGNTWEKPFSTGKFHISADFIYEPTGCDQQTGGGGYPELPVEDPLTTGGSEPPQPLIVNHGNGIYDTLNTSASAQSLPADQLLFMQGMKQELLGNFSSAVDIYKNVITGYRDSLSAISSMKRLLKCSDRLNSDSTAYGQLRSYFLNLASNNQNDTNFAYIARELSTKCLVRLKKYADAITEYENSISGSNDSLHILNAELNIIETYMIMTQHGDAPGFTGRLANLKPSSAMDGYKKLKEKLYKLKDKPVTTNLPVKFSLSQNYPNPFNPLTKINYSVPNSVKVTLVVYDILGRVVRSLVNEFKEAGKYEITFDGTGLASGVYFYKIEAGNFVDSKKMVLVK